MWDLRPRNCVTHPRPESQRAQPGIEPRFLDFPGLCRLPPFHPLNKALGISQRQIKTHISIIRHFKPPTLTELIFYFSLPRHLPSSLWDGDKWASGAKRSAKTTEAHGLRTTRAASFNALLYVNWKNELLQGGKWAIMETGSEPEVTSLDRSPTSIYLVCDLGRAGSLP